MGTGGVAAGDVVTYEGADVWLTCQLSWRFPSIWSDGGGMSVIQSVTTTRSLQFYRSSPAPCPYLPGRVERKLFTRLDGDHAPEINSTLSFAGFRRSHDIIYKPTCPGCSACVAVRVPVDCFLPNRRQRKILHRGRNFLFLRERSAVNRDIYQLFSSYQKARHVDSDMARMSFDDFRAMMTEGEADTSTFALFEETSSEKTRGIMLADRLRDGWSAVYSFYDVAPENDRLSLGTLMILRLIEQAQADGLPYVYLGYWVRNCQKMDYKSQFQPIELLGPRGWSVDSSSAADHNAK